MNDLTELVARARQGDKAAFDQLIQLHNTLAQRVARRLVWEPGIADELAQEAWLQAYLSLDNLQNPARFASWLYGIVLNVCRSYLRQQRINWTSLDTLVGGRWLPDNPFVTVEPGPEEIAEARDLHRRVLRAVQALSPANRDAVLLFYYEQLNHSEIATLLGISVTALKGRLHRARQQLRTELLPVHEDIRGEKIMIAVKYANLIRAEAQLNTDEEPAIWYVMLLLDETGRRVLPIWIGEHESQMLAASLQFTRAHSAGSVPSKIRPVTYVLIARILDALNAGIEEVQISALMNDVFYATLKVGSGDTTHEIDARPSDAVPLALIYDKPIRVSPEIDT